MIGLKLIQLVAINTLSILLKKFTIPHPIKDFKPKTLNGILEQTDLK